MEKKTITDSLNLNDNASITATTATLPINLKK